MRKIYVYSLPEKIITTWACGSIDHFRDHGFLLTRKDWVLSPAYDLNPTLSDHQSLLINRMTSASDLDVLLASAGDYMLSPAKSHTIIQEVKTAMQPWRSEARKLGIPQRDIERFATRFERWVGGETQRT